MAMTLRTFDDGTDHVRPAEVARDAQDRLWPVVVQLGVELSTDRAPPSVGSGAQPVAGERPEPLH